MHTETKSDDFRPTASWQNLRLRAELLSRLRRFFAGRRFLEVETPLLSADVVVDRHLEPLCVINANVDGNAMHSTASQPLWLQTSPEAAMKRLMAAGGEAIFQVTRSFRRGERGRLHNLEFTIVEWYRRNDTMQAGIAFLDDLCQTLLETESARRTSYAEAFERNVGIDPHLASINEMAEAAHRHGLAPPLLETADRDAWLDFLLVERVEPNLGRNRPEILYDYPASQASLAQVRAGPPSVAERFELYYRGIELANGYHELTDPQVLHRRTIEANAQRIQERKAAVPGPKRLLAAMEHGLPACSGAALGFDRIVMLAAGATSIDEVIAFPIERA